LKIFTFVDDVESIHTLNPMNKGVERSIFTDDGESSRHSASTQYKLQDLKLTILFSPPLSLYVLGKQRRREDDVKVQL
jgi:hypothetical protein